MGGNDPGFPVTMIRGRDASRRSVNVQGNCEGKVGRPEEKQPVYRFSVGADGSDVSPDDSDQSACRSAARLRCPETRRFRHVFGVRLRWPDGFPQLPEGPKQAATE